MIQRIQSLLMLLAALSILVINFKFPILELNEKKLLMQHFMYAQIALFTSAFLVIYSILQYKNRSKQLLINQISKLSLSISFFIVFFQKGDFSPTIGLFLFLVPYLLLVFSNYFIKKDDKLVKSADRIR
tara:strand:- start:1218 stop:1604 length:387 start_codon:yes stop_codon:yes gene_type:complete